MRDLGTSIGGMVPYADFQQNVRKFLRTRPGQPWMNWKVNATLLMFLVHVK